MKNRIDILYIKGKKTPNDDLEMKYSLRSLERYVVDYGRIFITGECPEYIDQTKVIYTPEKDIGTPMINHWWKVKQTIEKTDIGTEFILMYDDIFFITVQGLINMPAYCRGKLGEQRTGSIGYQKCLQETKKWLIDKGYRYQDFELHTPFKYDRNLFLALDCIYEPIKDSELGMAVRSIYGNMFYFNYEMRPDVKIRSSKDRVEDIPVKNRCVSVSDTAFKYNVQPWCESHFQTKSRWEK